MRKPVGKRLLPPATVGALPLDSTAGCLSGSASCRKSLDISNYSTLPAYSAVGPRTPDAHDRLRQWDGSQRLWALSHVSSALKILVRCQ